MSKRYLVTGGAGFIGSAVVRHLIFATDNHVLVVDKLTYASSLNSLAPVKDHRRYGFARADIADAETIRDLLASFRPDVIMHLAAESHVDRSIDGPTAFIQTNVVGTFVLLQQALGYWRSFRRAKPSSSASTIFRPMRCLARLAPTAFSTKRVHTDLIHRIQPQKRDLTTSFAHGITRMVCRSSFLIARTIMALIIFRRSLFH